jgi:hypothetical protein
MRRWGIGYNNYYFTSSIHLEEAPWYVFMLETTIQNICHYFPRIPLPKIKIIRDNEKTNLREYYGTTGDLFHVYICEPIFGWCWNKIKENSFNFPYLTLKEQYPDSFEDEDLWDEDQLDEVKENEEYSKMIGDEFNIVYKKLSKIADTRMKI